jgi:hypothetical protein
MILDFERNKIENMEEFTLSLKEFNRLEGLELYLNSNLLSKLPAFSISNNQTSNVMILNFEENKIEKIEEFLLSLKDFNRLEILKLYLNNNLFTKLPAFSYLKKIIDNNVMNKMILLILF